MAHKKKRRWIALLTVGMLSLGLMTGGSVYAVTPEQAESALSSSVYNKMSDNEYVLEGGGTISGKELFNKEGNAQNGVQYVINSEQLQDLEQKERQKFGKELVESAKEQVGENGVTSTTVNNYFQKVQRNSALGTQIIADAVDPISPNIAGAKNILKPAYKPLNLWMGAGVIVTFAMISAHFILNILYLTVPSVQTMFGGTEGESSKKKGNFLVSKSAIAAVKESDAHTEGYKSPLWTYIRYSFLEGLATGITIVLLITGNLWVIVMWLIEISLGFFGF